MSVIENYKLLKEEIHETAIACGRNPDEIQLVAVSKGQNWETISPLYQKGCRAFGENRLQEALLKMDLAPLDCQWHFIGSLQKNKVRKAIGPFVMIHSVDSLELAQKISEISLEKQLVSTLLLQVNTSGEESKQGFTPENCFRTFSAIMQLQGVHVKGLMTMAPWIENEKVIRKTFQTLRLLRDKLVEEYKPSQGLPDLSMGMSHDFKLAIAEGATILRIGTRLWANK